MKNFVIGRKNFLFCFTENGADSSAIAYSIVETAVANNLNVYEYLTYEKDGPQKAILIDWNDSYITIVQNTYHVADVAVTFMVVLVESTGVPLIVNM